MAGPLRKPRQKNTAGEPAEEKRRLSLRLSPPVLGVAAVALVTMVGWSFFMGFMVGRGQNPEQRVEQMTGLRQTEQAAPNPAPAPEAGAGPQTTPGALPGEAARAAPQAQDAAPGEASPAAKGQQEQTAAPGQKAHAGQPAAPVPTGPAQQAYPFSSPSGSGLAAWGIKQPATGQQPGQAAPNAGKAAGEAAAAGPAPTQGKPLYDFVFQVAAFKNQNDAEKLRSSLEGKGLRSRLQKSGKVQLVMVSLRGTELDAANLREEMKRMKLGAPTLASQKAVPGKDRKTGR